MELWRYGRAIEHLGQRYHLQKPLGSGGMADVCLAWDERDQRQVAIKVIKQDALDQRHLDRFVKEAAQVAQWRHPHILRFYSDLKLELLDASSGSIIPYIVMEYAQGGDLHKRLTPGQPYPLVLLLTLFPQLCSAVSYAHQRGVIHRDLKPLNILFRVTPDGQEQAVLSDFGLAVEISSTHHTFAHGGTLPYMAPEQFRGYVTPASDIFALGVILYLLTTGHLPFRRSLRSMIELRGDQPTGSQPRPVSAMMKPPVPPSLLQPTIPTAFDAVIARALATDPTQRHPDALTLWEEARAALYASDMHASTELRSDTRRARAVRISTASLSVPPADMAPAATPPIVSRLRAPIDTGYEDRISSDAASDPIMAIGEGHSSSHHSSRSSSHPSSRSTILRPTSHPTASRRSPTPLFLGLAALTLLLLLGASFAYLPAMHTMLPANVPLLSNAANVTISPVSRTLTQSYPLTAVLGNVDPAQMQVPARVITTPVQSQQKTANATGMRKTAGAQAKGMLTFFNGAFTTQTVPAGTVVTDKNGVQIVSDEVATIPPASPNTGTNGRVTVAAHSVSGGTTGNIRTMDINQTCCINDNTIFVKNLNAFTGGQDPKNYAFVQQSDVDAVANPLKATLTQQALPALRGQIAPNEQPATALSANACTPNVTSDHPIGDTGTNVASANITVTVTCSIEVYDSAAAKSLAANQLSARAAATLGSGYALAASRAIHADITVQGIDQQRTIALSVQASGTWFYRFSDDQRQSLARQLTGKSRAAALRLLQHTPGIAAATIPTRVTSLPGDPTQINIIVNSNPGA